MRETRLVHRPGLLHFADQYHNIISIVVGKPLPELYYVECIDQPSAWQSSPCGNLP